jgi:hypothetical protein
VPSYWCSDGKLSTPGAFGNPFMLSLADFINSFVVATAAFGKIGKINHLYTVEADLKQLFNILGAIQKINKP